MTIIQIIGILFFVIAPILRLGYEIAKHGEEKKKDTYNWYMYLIALIIQNIVYYKLGIFNLLWQK